MSIAEYLDRTIPGGRSSNLYRFLDVAYNIEYGAETAQQSTLNFLYLIGFTKQTTLELFGDSDERFHVRGGNDQIATRLRAALTGRSRSAQSSSPSSGGPTGRSGSRSTRGRKP